VKLRIALALAALCVALSLAPASALGHVVTRGLNDNTMLNPDPAVRAAFAHEAYDQLHARVLRLGVAWYRLEPSSGQIDQAYLTLLTTAVTEAKAKGLRVIISLSGTPRWASEVRFWTSPPPSYAAGYQPFYPPRTDALNALTATTETLATALKGQVEGYECWNEPNLYLSLYPQTTSTDDGFAAHRYVAMLQAFAAGVRAGDPDALVIAGATAPIGSNDIGRTSPLRFARLLAAAGAGAFFDVYSHHPYTPGGSVDLTPEAKPTDPTTTVSLGNIGSLLKVFPDKRFYLDEYAYNTAYTKMWGGAQVTQIDQARYLRRAYAYAARFPQIKMLLWHLIRDGSPTGSQSDPRGTYCGLRTVKGSAKRAWYAFARGNHLTVNPPTRVRRGQAAVLKGSLSNASVGGVRGKPLVVMAKRPRSSWKTIAIVRSGDGGAYRYRFWPARTAAYKVVWRGVVSSPICTIRVY